MSTSGPRWRDFQRWPWCGSVARRRRKGKSQSIQTGDGEMVGENVGYLQWMMGFVSGFNAAHADDVQRQVVREFDVAGMDLWLRNWCNKHPTQKILHGASAFIDEMRSNTEKRK